MLVSASSSGMSPHLKMSTSSRASSNAGCPTASRGTGLAFRSTGSWRTRCWGRVRPAAGTRPSVRSARSPWSPGSAQARRARSDGGRCPGSWPCSACPMHSVVLRRGAVHERPPPRAARRPAPLGPNGFERATSAGSVRALPRASDRSRSGKFCTSRLTPPSTVAPPPGEESTKQLIMSLARACRAARSASSARCSGS